MLVTCHIPWYVSHALHALRKCEKLSTKVSDSGPQILRTVRDGLLYAPLTDETDKLERARHKVLESLAYKAEYRTDRVTRHLQRVGNLSASIAQKIGMPQADVEILRRAAPLHDVGTIQIPETILFKPGRLSEDEFEVVKEHPKVGAEMLSNESSPLIRTAQKIALTHHERYDGQGYPNHLEGNDIPLVGQIVSVVDILDTLTSDRPYKPAWGVGRALTELNQQGGKQVNPRLVTVLRRVLFEEGVLADPRQMARNRVFIQGTFHSITLFALLRLIAERRRSLRLVTFCGLSKGEFLVYKGHLVHVRFEGFAGEQAFFQTAIEIENRSDAKFIVEGWEVRRLPDVLVNIHEPLEQLIHKAAVALHQLGLLNPGHAKVI
jgi:putative nucleotidyltransferase with HDIG domain